MTAFVALVPFPLNENMHRAGIRVVAHGSRRMMTNGYWNNIAMWQTAVTFIGLLTALLMIGVSFAMIDGLRGRSDHRFSWTQMFKIFERGEYFLGLADWFAASRLGQPGDVVIGCSRDCQRIGLFTSPVNLS